jgi:hypothetical protein
MPCLQTLGLFAQAGRACSGRSLTKPTSRRCSDHERTQTGSPRCPKPTGGRAARKVGVTVGRPAAVASRDALSTQATDPKPSKWQWERKIKRVVSASTVPAASRGEVYTPAVACLRRDPRAHACQPGGLSTPIAASASHIGCSLKILTCPGYTNASIEQIDLYVSVAMAKGPRPWARRAEPHGGRPVPSGSSQRSRPTTTPLRGRGGSRRLAVCSVSPTEQAALDLLSCQLRALEQAVVDAAPVPFRPNPLAPIRVGDYWIAAALCKRVVSKARAFDASAI